MRRLALACMALACACEPTEVPALARTGHVSGDVTTGAAGDVWLFLYRPGEGPPGQPVEPLAVTAISAPRLAASPRFVFADVAPNTYRLYALQDVDADFDGTVDVLSQATAGDRVSAGQPVQAQPGRGARADVVLSTVVHTEPPAFSVAGDVAPDVALDALTPLTLESDALGLFDPQRTAFTFGLLDADGDAVPDDVDGDGSPDLSLQLFLRWLPLPGQLEAGASVVVPLLFDPSPFLLTLENRLDTTVAATRLQVVMLPQALLQSPAADGGAALTVFGSPPPGAYELLALQAGGQFWRLPNQLSSRVPSQGVRFHLDGVR